MIRIVQNETKFTLNIESYLINALSKTNLNLFLLSDVIKKQIKQAFNHCFGKFDLNCTIFLRPLYTYKLKQLYGKTVFAVVDDVRNNNVAEADFRGLLVKINVSYLAALISGPNERSIPHEFEHLLGFDHPHARAAYLSVNTSAWLHEQQLSEEERQCNLMRQPWYIQKSGNKINESVLLTESQVKLLLENYGNKKLNYNYGIRRSIFYYKWTVKL